VEFRRFKVAVKQSNIDGSMKTRRKFGLPQIRDGGCPAIRTFIRSLGTLTVESV